MKGTWLALLALLLLAAPAKVQAQSGDNFDYSINSSNASTITISSYTGPRGAVIVPTNINGLTVTVFGDGTSVFADTTVSSVTLGNSVTTIGELAFYNCSTMSSVALGSGVTSIGEDAFYDCSGLSTVTIPSGVSSIGFAGFYNCDGLATVYFTGNAPQIPPDNQYIFVNDPATGYYLPGTTGWSNFSTYADLQMALWNPMIQASGTNFGVKTNQFGFNVIGTNNFTVVVEACTNLANPVWTPLATNTLVNGSFHFSEPFQSNTQTRFYGLAMP